MSGFEDYTPDPDPREPIAEVPSPGDPLGVATTILEHVYTQGGIPHLVYWAGGWWRYHNHQWAAVDERRIRRDLYTFLGRAVYHDKGEEKPFHPTMSKITGILEPLSLLAEDHLPEGTTGTTWQAGHEHDADASHMVALGNGLLDYTTGQFMAHTPALFTPFTLPFDYDPQAAAPTWQHFLDEVFEHDPAGRAALQEWFGYVLSGRTDLQKALVLIGLPAAGKGTIAEALKAVTGVSNTVATSLDRLGGRFNMASWEGKLLALMGDARDDGRTTIGAAGVSTILSVIGEDPITIERKGKDPYTLNKMTARVMIVANSEPSFSDNTGAIGRRILGIKLTKSFEGKTDPNVKAQILNELPGIFNWALEGLRRLEQQGGFTTPASQETVLKEMQSLGGPIKEFLEDVYVITGNESDQVPFDETYRVYATWCESSGRGHLSKQKLRNQISNANIAVHVRRKEVGKWKGEKARSRKWFTVGVLVE